MTTDDSQVWIGLIEVGGPPSHPDLAGCPGAFVHLLTFVSSEAEYRGEARGEVERRGLVLAQVQWCERLSSRLARFDVSEELVEVAEAVSATHVGAFSVFHAWSD